MDWLSGQTGAIRLTARARNLPGRHGVGMATRDDVTGTGRLARQPVRYTGAPAATSTRLLRLQIASIFLNQPHRRKLYVTSTAPFLNNREKSPRLNTDVCLLSVD